MFLFQLSKKSQELIKPQNSQSVLPYHGTPMEQDYSLDIPMEISEFMKLVLRMNEKIYETIKRVLKFIIL